MPMIFVVDAGNRRDGVGACVDADLSGDRLGGVERFVEWKSGRHSVCGGRDFRVDTRGACSEDGTRSTESPSRCIR